MSTPPRSPALSLGSSIAGANPVPRTFDGARPCGESACRVCIALGFLSERSPRDHRRAPGVDPLPGGHHPLSSRGSLARADEIYAFMLVYQREHGTFATLLAISKGIGLRSAGLLSRYMRRLEQQGRVSRVPDAYRREGKCKHHWMAVDPAIARAA